MLWTRWRPEMRHETSLDYRLEWLNSLHLELKLAILDKVDDYTLENLDTLKAIAAKRERVIIQAYGSYEEKEGIKPKNQDSKAEKKKKIPCRFYEQGNCTRKDCPYKHEKKDKKNKDKKNNNFNKPSNQNTTPAAEERQFGNGPDWLKKECHLEHKKNHPKHPVFACPDELRRCQKCKKTGHQTDLCPEKKCQKCNGKHSGRVCGWSTQVFL